MRSTECSLYLILTAIKSRKLLHLSLYIAVSSDIPQQFLVAAVVAAKAELLEMMPTTAASDRP